MLFFFSVDPPCPTAAQGVVQDPPPSLNNVLTGVKFFTEGCTLPGGWGGCFQVGKLVATPPKGLQALEDPKIAKNLD